MDLSTPPAGMFTEYGCSIRRTDASQTRSPGTVGQRFRPRSGCRVARPEPTERLVAECDVSRVHTRTDESPTSTASVTECRSFTIGEFVGWVPAAAVMQSPGAVFPATRAILRRAQRRRSCTVPQPRKSVSVNRSRGPDARVGQHDGVRTSRTGDQHRGPVDEWSDTTTSKVISATQTRAAQGRRSPRSVVIGRQPAAGSAARRGVWMGTTRWCTAEKRSLRARRGGA